MPLRPALLLPLGVALSCRPAARGDEVRYIPVEGGAPLPFSAAVRVGPLFYLSGQIGMDSTGHLVPGGISAETRQALENIRAVLERNGSSLDRVVRCTAMLADIHDWGAMNPRAAPSPPADWCSERASSSSVPPASAAQPERGVALGRPRA